ncbi:hypothetical protein AB990_02435, partial [Alkalihalobacillus pseudalcaliphilus]
MSKPLVSVIVPIFNSEKFLEKCINSVLKQSYNNLELIIVDDGSTDNSKSIVTNFAEVDSRIKYIYQDNMGPSYARNKGLDNALGQYIQFIDSDDFLEKNTTELLVGNLDNSDLVIAGYENVYVNENKENTKVIPENNCTINKSEFMTSFSYFLKEQLFHYTWHKLYKRELLKNVRFNNELNIGEDLIFNIDYMDNVNKITFVNEKIYN